MEYHGYYQQFNQQISNPDDSPEIPREPQKEVLDVITKPSDLTIPITDNKPKSDSTNALIYAWTLALRETKTLLHPLWKSKSFIPIMVSIITAFLYRRDVANEGFIKYFLICGSVALIAKKMPNIIIPTIISYFCVKTFGRK